MKQILVIGSLSSEAGELPAQSEMAQFVARSLKTKIADYKVNFCHLDEIGYMLDNSTTAVFDLRNNLDLKHYDLVFFRGKLAASINIASTVAQYLEDCSIPYVNTAYAKRRPIGKIPQMFQLVKLKLAIPKTVSAAAAYLPELIDHYLVYPVIVKDVQGAHGDNNFLVGSRAELAEILAQNLDITFMAQEFIENEGDYRVLLVGNKTAIIHRKGQDGSHLNNTSAGGRATLIELADFSPAIVAESRQFAQLCGYEIAGVDAIIDKNTGKHYFLEINSQPQLASGAFIELKSQLLGDYFSELLGVRG